MKCVILCARTRWRSQRRRQRRTRGTSVHRLVLERGAHVHLSRVGVLFGGWVAERERTMAVCMVFVCRSPVYVNSALLLNARRFGTQQPLNNLILCYRRASKIRQVCNVLVMDNSSNFFAETLSVEQIRTLRRRAIESNRIPCIVYSTYRFYCTQINVQLRAILFGTGRRAPTSLCHQHASRRKIFPPENILKIQSVTRQAYLVAEMRNLWHSFALCFHRRVQGVGLWPLQLYRKPSRCARPGASTIT